MSRYFPDFAGIFCLVVFLISLASLSGELLRDGDSFWHIKAGSVMLEQQSLIKEDIFSHTAAGAPWTAHEWLSEIIMAGVYKLTGLEGLLCFFLSIVALTFWILYKTTEKYANQIVTLACVSLALAFSPMHMSARPHLFSWLFMVLTLAILLNGRKWLYCLPIIIVIWANLHGGFILGLVLQAIFILGSSIDSLLVSKNSFRHSLQEQKTAITVFLVSVVVVGLNPFGYQLLLFPFQVSQGVFSELINEWRAPDLQSMWYFRFYLIALLVLVSLRKSAATWTERLLIVFFLNAALTHIRHISIMLIALTPFIARMVNNIWPWQNKSSAKDERKELLLSSKTGPAAMALIVLTLLTISSTSPGSLSFLTPEQMIKVDSVQLTQLIDFIEKDSPEGKLFNEYSLGGYLLYALTSPPRVFIDGRADMYGEKILTDYGKILSSDDEREKLLDQYEISWIIFEKESDLIKKLVLSGEWQTTYTNDYYAVIERTFSTTPKNASGS
jgi:hypothetical protein